MVWYTEHKVKMSRLMVQADIFKHRMDKNHVESSQQKGGLNAQESGFPWPAVFFRCVRRERGADCLVISFLLQKS